MMTVNRFARRSDDGMMLIFGRCDEPLYYEYQFKCTLYLSYITRTMNQRDFRKLIKVIIWACEDPNIILAALRIIEDAFTTTIKLSTSAPKNMKYLQEVKSKYELQ